MARVTKTMAERRFQNWAYQYMLTLLRREERQAKTGKVLHYDEPPGYVSKTDHRQVIADSLGPMEDYRQTRYAAELWEANAKGAMSTVIELKAKIDAAIRILQG